jgi:hypothetical protein
LSREPRIPEKLVSGETTDWTELREFRNVQLTDSFVLSWMVEAGALLVDLDLCLGPEHTFYEKPRPAEKVCVRPAILEFPQCTQASIDAASRNAGTLADAIRHFGAGRISGFSRTGEGEYRLTGRFGIVTIHAERPILRLKGPA